MTETTESPDPAAGETRGSVIVVGYSAQAEGRAALQRAVSEATLRGTSLLVVHTAPDAELSELEEQLAAAGVPHEVQAARDSLDPADEVLKAAESSQCGVHRDRAAPPFAGRQAAARQQRPAGAAGRGLPGAGGQGRARFQIRRSRPAL